MDHAVLVIIVKFQTLHSPSVYLIKRVYNAYQNAQQTSFRVIQDAKVVQLVNSKIQLDLNVFHIHNHLMANAWVKYHKNLVQSYVTGQVKWLMLMDSVFLVVSALNQTGTIQNAYRRPITRPV